MNNFQLTTGDGDRLLVFIAQSMNPEDANNNYNGNNIPQMPEAGGGGASQATYTPVVLSRAQQQTYEVLSYTFYPTLIVLLFCFAIFKFKNRRHKGKRVKIY